MIKKAMRPTQANPEGGIATMEAPIHVSNVMLICPSCNKATRVSNKRVDGKRFAFARSAALISIRILIGLYDPRYQAGDAGSEILRLIHRERLKGQWQLLV